MNTIEDDGEEVPSWEEISDLMLEHLRDMPAHMARALAAQILNERPVPRKIRPDLVLIKTEDV